MIVITGAAGFIGSVVAGHLNALGYPDLILVDDFGTTDKWKNLRQTSFAAIHGIDEFQKMVEENRLSTAIKAIIHLGACSSTTERNADYMMRNNYGYTRMLAEWALKHSVRFIYASSAATYGDGEQGFSDNHDGLRALNPLNVYGFSKYAFDLWAHESGALSQMVGLKFFNVFGPNEYHKAEMLSMVVRGYEQVKQSQQIRLFRSYRPEFADGGQQRDFVYVKDCAAVIAWLLKEKDVQGIYNLGTGVARSWLDLSNALFAAMKQTPKIEFIEMPESMRDRYQYFTQANMSKLRAAGYTNPMTTLEDAVSDYVVSYLEPGYLTFE